MCEVERDSMQTKPSTPREILVAARELIGDPERWTRGQYARAGHKDMFGVSPWSESASCWCARGAMRRVSDPVQPQPMNVAHATLSDVARGRYPGRIPQNNDPVSFVNDEMGHAAVLEILDAAISVLPIT